MKQSQFSFGINCQKKSFSGHEFEREIFDLSNEFKQLHHNIERYGSENSEQSDSNFQIKEYMEPPEQKFRPTEISFEIFSYALKDISNIPSFLTKDKSNITQYDLFANDDDQHNKENLISNGKRKMLRNVDKSREKFTQTDVDLPNLGQNVQLQQETITLLQEKISKLQIENIKLENTLKVAQENIASRGKVISFPVKSIMLRCLFSKESK